MSDQASFLLSVVIPFRNFDGRIADHLAEVARIVEPLVADYEIIVIDNGSTDAEFADYAPLVRDDGMRNLQVYRLIQRVDNDTAAWAGVENSLGDYVLVYDPRSENLSRLPDAIAELAKGREVVYLRNTSSTDKGLLQRLWGPMFRWAFKRLVGVDLSRDATPGRLISKRVVSYLLLQPYPGLRYRPLPSLAGFSKTTLTYAAPLAPDPTYGTVMRIQAAMRLILANSMAPLRIASSAALVGAILNMFYTVYVVLVAILKRDVAPGWSTLSLQQSGMFFLLSMVMFVVIEYLIQMVRWTAAGPTYFVSSEATSAVLTRRQKLNVESATHRPVAVAQTP